MFKKLKKNTFKEVKENIVLISKHIENTIKENYRKE